MPVHVTYSQFHNLLIGELIPGFESYGFEV
jgi:hypothetical protein